MDALIIIGLMTIAWAGPHLARLAVVLVRLVMLTAVLIVGSLMGKHEDS